MTHQFQVKCERSSVVQPDMQKPETGISEAVTREAIWWVLTPTQPSSQQRSHKRDLCSVTSRQVSCRKQHCCCCYEIQTGFWWQLGEKLFKKLYLAELMKVKHNALCCYYLCAKKLAGNKITYHPVIMKFKSLQNWPICISLYLHKVIALHYMFFSEDLFSYIPCISTTTTQPTMNCPEEDV